jgi:hypothetical protein
MTINYSDLLSSEQKKAILEQRLQQFAAEAWQHQMNRDLATRTGNADGIEQANQALTILEEAINLHQEELAKLAE